jgi:LEA14-like dessication related protein
MPGETGAITYKMKTPDLKSILKKLNRISDERNKLIIEIKSRNQDS